MKWYNQYSTFFRILTFATTGILALLMLILTSVFIQSYLENIARLLGTQGFFGLNNRLAHPITLFMLCCLSIIYALIRKNHRIALLGALMVIASYGIYGYLIAAFYAIGGFTQPLYSLSLILLFFISISVVNIIKQHLHITTIIPGMQSIGECIFWLGICFAAGHSLYPTLRAKLIATSVYRLFTQVFSSTESTTFLSFLALCLGALILLLMVQKQTNEPFTLHT